MCADGGRRKAAVWSPHDLGMGYVPGHTGCFEVVSVETSNECQTSRTVALRTKFGYYYYY